MEYNNGNRSFWEEDLKQKNPEKSYTNNVSKY